MTRETTLAVRLYRWLARALPEDFLRSYGPEMVAAGEDAIRDVAARRGYRGLAFLMFRLVIDVARRLPAEHLNELAGDIRHGLRTLMSSKGMVLAIGLSTGLTIAISLGTYNEMSVVFHAVPGVGEPDGLFTMQLPASYPDFERYSNPAGPFAAVAAYQGPVPLSIRRGNSSDRLWGHIVTPNYFEVLKAGAAAGSTFNNETAGTASLIISEGYWQRHFGGSLDAIGQTLEVNGEAAIIKGVAAKEFIGASPLTSAAEIWISTNANPKIAPELAPATLHNPLQVNFHLIGRLKPGIKPSQAEAQLEVTAKELQKEKGDPTTNQTRLVTVLPGGQLVPIRKEDIPSTVAPAVILEGLLLLLACTNASTLLMARAGARRREITIRAALGASRRRMIKQLLTESVVLAIPGGIIGLSLAIFLNLQSQKAIANVFPPYIRLDLAMGWPAAVLGFGISVMSGIFFGVVPAFRSTRMDLLSGLKAGTGWFLPRYRWISSRNALVALQTASSIAVVIMVGIIAIGFQRASKTTDFGFEPHDLYTFSIDPLREGYSAERTWTLLRALPDQMRQFPGIVEVSVAENPPIGDVALRTMAPRLGATTATLAASVRSGTEKRILRRVTNEYVGARYFETLSVKPLRGDVFTSRENSENSKAIVINATLAEEAWPSQNPVGQGLEIGDQSFEVIGVINDFRTSGLFASSLPVAFHLLGPEQIAKPSLQGVTVMVRGNPVTDLQDKLKPYFNTIDPNLTVFGISRQNDRLTQALFLARIQTMSYGIIGLFGLLLAAIGLAGVTGYAVAQRTKEIGIRVALGATRFDILRVVSREGTWLVIAGVLIGEAAALGVTSVVNSWYARLFEITRTSSSDPYILIGVPALLGALTMLSCYVPARRALRVDPLSALRED